MDDNNVIISVNSDDTAITLEVQESGGSSDVTKAYVDAHDASTLDSSKAYTDSVVDGKVDKVSGKGLSTNDYTTADKEKVAQSLTAVPSDYAKKQYVDLSSSTALDNANSYTDSAVADKATTAQVQAAVADKATVSQVQAAVTQANTYTDTAVSGKADRSDIPDVSGFITNTVADLVNYYTKAETYTKAEVNSLVSSLSGLSIQIVAELPDTGQANIIYLVPKSGSTNDTYSEYIWINSTWEKIGSTDIDLTDYAKTADVNTAVAGAINTSEGYTDTAVAAKVDKVTGKGLSSNDYTAADKAKVGAALTAIPAEYVTDTELDTALGAKADINSPNFTGNILLGYQLSSGGSSNILAGQNITASGNFIYAFGQNNNAAGYRCILLGKGLSTGGSDQILLGEYNEVVTDANIMLIVGIGTYDNSANGLTLDRDGNLVIAGDITNGSGDTLSSKANSADVYTKSEIDTKLGDIDSALLALIGG